MQLDQLFDEETCVHLARSAKTAQKVEAAFVARVRVEIAKTLDNIIHAARNDGAMPHVDFEKIYMQCMLEALKKGYETRPVIRLASDRGYPPGRDEKKQTLFEKWKELADRGYKPKRIKELARKTAKKFTAAVERFRSMWKEQPEVQGDKEWAKELLIKELHAPESYAKMVVATETTRAYNAARIDYYEQVPSVTHYLFISIRDNRTTDWCKTRQHLIYKSGSALLKKNTPPLHPYCRSEIVPLNKHNPRSVLLINDESMWAENNHPAPLLPGWNE